MKPKQLKVFKQTRAKELRDLAKALETTFQDVNASSIYEASAEIENIIPTLKTGEKEKTYWGYSLDNLVLPLSTIRHIKPKNIPDEALELSISIKLIADARMWNTLSDPFLELNFKMEVVGLSTDKVHSFGWHIDRYTVDKHNNEPHPLYHVQYTNDFLSRTEDFDWGQTLFLDTPRLLHHPVDLILGIGLATVNFHPEGFDKLMNNGYFVSVYEEYQDIILAPYYHNLSSHWQSVSGLKWNSPKDLCPHLV